MRDAVWPRRILLFVDALLTEKRWKSMESLWPRFQKCAKRYREGRSRADMPGIWGVRAKPKEEGGFQAVREK